MHPYKLAEKFGMSDFRQKTKSEVASLLNPRFRGKYFVVEIQENGSRIFARELKLRAWAHRVYEDEFQIDAETQAVLKAKSASVLDDGTNRSVGVDGEFDIYIRPVRWWDVRHWLNHPSREIRYALYVGIFAATLEYSGDIIDLVRRLLATPPT